MPNYIRPQVTGATIFFSVRLAQQGGDLLLRHINLLRDTVRVVRRAQPFDICAWVVLPDHMHAIWRLPAGDAGYSERWRVIKAEFSKSLGETGPRGASRLAKGEVGLWQRRFWDHHIRDRADYDLHLHYCWNDPVRHGLASRPVEWPHSSFHRDVREGRVDAAWMGAMPEGVFGE